MNKKGFTLIELLVVIAIIGLLSTLSVVALGSARAKSRDSKRLSDIKQVQTALELFYTDQGNYPGDTNLVLGIDTETNRGICLNVSGFAGANCENAYMGLVPKDPQNSGSYIYIYNASEDKLSYTITAQLEKEINGIAGTITATPSGITGSGSTAAPAGD